MGTALYSPSCYFKPVWKTKDEFIKNILNEIHTKPVWMIRSSVGLIWISSSNIIWHVSSHDLKCSVRELLCGHFKSPVPIYFYSMQKSSTHNTFCIAEKKVCHSGLEWHERVIVSLRMIKFHCEWHDHDFFTSTISPNTKWLDQLKYNNSSQNVFQQSLNIKS